MKEQKEIFQPYVVETKYVNEVKKVLKCILVINLSELKYVASASALLVCEKVGVK